MKVIGIADRDTYLCEVDHKELEKFMGLYYGKLDRLKVGEEVDLGKGHDFHQDTKIALEQTTAFIESNKKVIDTIMTGIKVMGREAPPEE